ncbi:hypothetical protein M408DRAFT_21052 [Serendipita vermifera MAFF 305830]|uniref:Uncharacterized protein n=1 Tax=Serendipita vermifera MAFF 305830 TaxID=933852 RepID=A0A0C3BI98_SERVB|nr:hypothetical protein M408DRAFT_21052 [Serendipita vermifera MAFF 305830]
MAQNPPFDVLCTIFEHYAELDRPAVPQRLETFLLVCRTWHGVASQHARIWSTFNLRFKAVKDVLYWASCVPRRLVRYTASALLDIKLATSPDGDVFKVSKTFERILLALVGDAGVTGQRWRTSEIDGRSTLELSHILEKCLSFPTPNLQEFRIDGLNCRRAVLPDTSALMTLSMRNCTLASLPSLVNVTNLRISTLHGFDGQVLAGALNVRTMKIEGREPYNLATTYPYLQSLKLRGIIHDGSLDGFCASALCELTLLVGRGRDYLPVVSCTGIQLKKLKRVKVGLYIKTSTMLPEYLTGLHRFLEEVVNLEELIFGDRMAASLVQTTYR